jgi:hypothetical protein
MAGVVALLIIGGVMFARWESRHATSFFARKEEEKRRKEFAEKNKEIYSTKKSKTLAKEKANVVNR